MLTQDQINQIAKLNGGTWTDPQTGRVYMAQYGSTGGVEQGGTNFLENVIGSGSGNFTQGNMISAVDPNTGKESADYLNPKSTLWKDALEFVGPPLMAAGVGYMASGGNLPFDIGGGGSGMDIGAAGAEGWGGPDILSKAALDGTNAFGANSIPGAYGVEAAAPLSKAALDGTTAFGANSVADAYYLGAPAASGGSWMSKIADAVGGKDNLKLIASLGGGLLAAGSDAPQTTRQSKMDPRLDPYVFGEQGVVPRASLLYDQRTNPTGQAMTDRAALRARAKGLLGI